MAAQSISVPKKSHFHLKKSIYFISHLFTSAYSPFPPFFYFFLPSLFFSSSFILHPFSSAFSLLPSSLHPSSFRLHPFLLKSLPFCHPRHPEPRSLGLWFPRRSFEKPGPTRLCHPEQSEGSLFNRKLSSLWTEDCGL